MQQRHGTRRQRSHSMAGAPTGRGQATRSTAGETHSAACLCFLLLVVMALAAWGVRNLSVGYLCQNQVDALTRTNAVASGDPKSAERAAAIMSCIEASGGRGDDESSLQGVILANLFLVAAASLCGVCCSVYPGVTAKTACRRGVANMGVGLLLILTGGGFVGLLVQDLPCLMSNSCLDAQHSTFRAVTALTTTAIVHWVAFLTISSDPKGESSPNRTRSGFCGVRLKVLCLIAMVAVLIGAIALEGVVLTCAATGVAGGSLRCGGAGGSPQIAVAMVLPTSLSLLLAAMTLYGNSVDVHNQRTALKRSENGCCMGGRATHVSLMSLLVILFLALFILAGCVVGGANLLLFAMPSTEAFGIRAEEVIVLPFIAALPALTGMYKLLSFAMNRMGALGSRFNACARCCGRGQELAFLEAVLKGKLEEVYQKLVESSSAGEAGRIELARTGVVDEHETDEVDKDPKQRGNRFCTLPWEHPSNRRTARIMADAMGGRADTKAMSMVDVSFVLSVQPSPSMLDSAVNIANLAAQCDTTDKARVGLNMMEKNILAIAIDGHLQNQKLKHSCICPLHCCQPHRGRCNCACIGCYDRNLRIPGDDHSVVCRPWMLWLIMLMLVCCFVAPGLHRLVHGGSFTGNPSRDGQYIVYSGLVLSTLAALRTVTTMDNSLSTLARLHELAKQLLDVSRVNVTEPAEVAQWSASLWFLVEVIKREVGGHHGAVVFAYSLASLGTGGFLTLWVILNRTLEENAAGNLLENPALWTLAIITVLYFWVSGMLFVPLLSLDNVISGAIELMRTRALAGRDVHALSGFLLRTSQDAVAEFRKLKHNLVRIGELVAHHANPLHAASGQAASPATAASSNRWELTRQERQQAGHRMQAILYAAAVAESWGSRYKGIKLPLFDSSAITVTLSATYAYSLMGAAALPVLTFVGRLALNSVRASD